MYRVLIKIDKEIDGLGYIVSIAGSIKSQKKNCSCNNDRRCHPYHHYDRHYYLISIDPSHLLKGFFTLFTSISIALTVANTQR